jgi:hypothetical protein
MNFISNLLFSLSLLSFGKKMKLDLFGRREHQSTFEEIKKYLSTVPVVKVPKSGTLFLFLGRSRTDQDTYTYTINQPYEYTHTLFL